MSKAAKYFKNRSLFQQEGSGLTLLVEKSIGKKTGFSGRSKETLLVVCSGLTSQNTSNKVMCLSGTRKR